MFFLEKHLSISIKRVLKKIIINDLKDDVSAKRERERLLALEKIVVFRLINCYKERERESGKNVWSLEGNDRTPSDEHLPVQCDI